MMTDSLIAASSQVIQLWNSDKDRNKDGSRGRGRGRGKGIFENTT